MYFNKSAKVYDRYLLRSCLWAADPGTLKQCILTAGRGRTQVPARAVRQRTQASPSSVLRSHPQQAARYLHAAEGRSLLSLQNQTLVFSTSILTGHLKIMLNQTSGLSVAQSGWRKKKKYINKPSHVDWASGYITVGLFSTLIG